MELRDLQYFALVAEHQNIGRAAEALNLSATALSKCLRRLEKSVGAKLVQRAAKGVALTAVGASLLTRIGPLQGMLSDVRHQATELAEGRSGHINAGVAAGTRETTLANAYVALSKESPTITLKVTSGNSSVLSRGLLHAFEHNGLPPPSIALEANSMTLRDAAIAHSDHVGLTSRQSVREDARKFPLVELPVKEMSYVRRTFIIYRKGAYLSPAALRLIAILKMQAREMSGGGRSAKRA